MITESGVNNYVFKDVDGQTVADALEHIRPTLVFRPPTPFQTGRCGAAPGLAPQAEIRAALWSN